MPIAILHVICWGSTRASAYHLHWHIDHAFTGCAEMLCVTVLTSILGYRQRQALLCFAAGSSMPDEDDGDDMHVDAYEDFSDGSGKHSTCCIHLCCH